MTAVYTSSRPTVACLRLDQLTVDRVVQRSLDLGRVRTMAEQFDMNAIGVITVSARPDGVFHIVDGQHRAAAAKARGLDTETVTCNVYQGLSRGQEAALFRLLNNTRQVQSIDKFRVRVVEGDPVAVTLDKLLTANGWRVDASKNSGAFAAVGALEKVYHGGKITTENENLRACRNTIEVITAAWGYNADGVRNEIVNGLGAFMLGNSGEVDFPKLVTELAKFEGGPLALIGKAKGLRDLRGGNVIDSMAEILTNLHNKGRRTRKLPAWQTT